MKTFPIFPTLFLMLVVQVSDASAALRIHANPVSGGGDLRFGRVDSPVARDEEVRIRITSGETGSYQVFQRMLDPLTNEHGFALDRQSIVATTIPGSNSTGSLYLQGEERVGYTDQLLYSSNPDGLSDSFTVIYHVNAEEISEGGSYLGRIQYLVRPSGGVQSDVVVMNVTLEVPAEREIRLTTSTPGQAVELRSDRVADQDVWAEFRILDTRRRLTFYQEVMEMPVDDLDQPLEEGLLEWWVEGGAGEVESAAPETVERHRARLYRSGRGEDLFRIHYRLNPDVMNGQRAGDYRGMVRIIAESDSGVQETWDLPLTVQIAPVFTLDIEYPPEGMHFARVLPQSPEQTREVRVRVESNMGQRYAVRQVLRGPLANERGDRLGEDQFLVYQEVLSGEGSVRDTQWNPVGEESRPIFTSGPEGGPAEFRVYYRLRPDPAMMPGDYQTAVVYSLEEI